MKNKEAITIAIAGILLLLVIVLEIVLLNQPNNNVEIIHEGATVKTTSESEIEIETVIAIEEIPTEKVNIAKPHIDTPLDEDMEIYIESVAREFGLEYELVLGVIATESQFYVDKVGDNGNSIGLMQIQPRYWQSLADELGANIYTPKGNIVVGCAILSKLMSMYDGNIEKVLKAYNSGNPNYNNNSYVDKVLSAMESYRN